MIFYIAAFKFVSAGIAATFSSLSPVFILPYIAVRYKIPIRAEAIVGAVLAVTGVAVILLIK